VAHAVAHADWRPKFLEALRNMQELDIRLAPSLKALGVSPIKQSVVHSSALI
jgi:hypothetical protein